MQSARDVKLGKSNEKNSDVGCVLTAYTRMASALIGSEVSLSDANKIAVDKYTDSNTNDSKYFSTIWVNTHDSVENKYDHTMNLDKDAYTMSENCGENIRVNDTSGVRTQLVDDPSGRKNKFIRMDFFKINQKQNSSQE